MNVAHLLDASARSEPDSPAISTPERRLWSYRELRSRASQLAAGLRQIGLGSGDRVVLAMTNMPEYYEVLFACWWAGLCVAPLNARLHPREMAYAIGDCGAKACFATAELAAGLRGQVDPGCEIVEVGGERCDQLHAAPMELTEVCAEAPAWIFYTSGTTGKPKGAIHTHRTLVSMVVSFLADSGAVRDDCIAHLAPMSHASGLLGLAYVSRGLNNVIIRGGSTDELRAALLRHGKASFFAVPTLLRRLLEPGALEAAHIQRIHRIFFGGAPMYVEDFKRAIAKLGVDRLWHLYGQGEAPNTITHLPPRLLKGLADDELERRLATVGIPRSGVAVRVSGGRGREAHAGQVGEVLVRGDVLMAGYWKNPTATRRALKGGWLHTGDLGRMDERGFLTLVDRSKDVIISGGSNIYPREIEEVLQTHPGVAECAVVAAPDPEWGETPIAFVVPRTPGRPLAAEHEALCLQNLGRYTRPRDYVILNQLPKNAYGKVLKTELRTLAVGRAIKESSGGAVEQSVS